MGDLIPGPICHVAVVGSMPWGQRVVSVKGSCWLRTRAGGSVFRSGSKSPGPVWLLVPLGTVLDGKKQEVLWSAKAQAMVMASSALGASSGQQACPTHTLELVGVQ